jgi:dipeptide transport system permease protein
MPADTVAIGTRPDAREAYSPPGPLLEFWRAFSENRGAVVGLCVVAAIALMAIFADWLAPHSPYEQFRDYFKVPPAIFTGGSWRFPLGTDAVGSDILSRLIFGSR